MDARAIREVIAEGLEVGSVWQLSHVDARGPFLAGTLDFELAKLDMDSLAKMELCIAIEVGTGVSLAPEELDRHPTLYALVAAIEERSRA